MLCGAVETKSRYAWAPLDAVRVLASNRNDIPEEASRPMSASADGFVPSAGAAVLHLEDMASAVNRGVMPYAEIVGVATNCGAQHNGGSLTAPNLKGIEECIRNAIKDCYSLKGIDLINGHLTATSADVGEVHTWARALDNLYPFPMIHSTKSILGHGLIAAGAMETVACCLMLRNGFIHPSINCEDIHPDIKEFEEYIPREGIEKPELNTIIKANFGFGDVNACIVLRKPYA
jgi:3-oxoacyl-(acyl-carrier-protein) synthase